MKYFKLVLVEKRHPYLNDFLTLLHVRLLRVLFLVNFQLTLGKYWVLEQKLLKKS